MSDFTIDEEAPLLVELAPGPGVQRVSLTVADLAERSGRAVDASMNAIHNMARRVTSAIETLTVPPSKVEVEFGVKLNAESGALITKAGGEATLKVNLTWERKEKTGEQ